LADELARLELAEAGGVWLIRRLDVRLCLVAGGTMREAARALARQVVRQLERALAAGPDHPDVLWYPSRAAFVAHWLVDLCLDRTTGRWEYDEFGTLPASAAVRQLGTAEPSTIDEALRSLPAHELDNVLSEIAPGDAAAIVHALCAGSRPNPVRAVAVAARSLLEAGRLPSDARRATLAVVLSLLEPSPVDADVARDLVTVIVALRTCGYASRPDLLQALRTGDWTTAARLGGYNVVTALSGWPAATRTEALATVAAVQASPPGEAEHSALGGVFLLLPLLAEIELGTEAPPLDDVPAERVIQLLAIIGVLGADRTGTLLADPWLHLALGIGVLDPAQITEWSRCLDTVSVAEHTLRHADGMAKDQCDPTLLQSTLLAPNAARALLQASSALLRELSSRLPGMATASAEHLHRNVLDLDATVHTDPERIVVELGQPPLNLLLSLTGMNRRTFVLPATGDRPWILTQRC
jgi:hypothetical protein